MADQSKFGVTADGFVFKGIDRIVADQQSRAQTMFGADVDLTSGSALRKVLDAVARDAQELWRGLEAQYYSNFVTTATGPSLDLLGTDLGIARRNLQAQGQVVLTLTNGATGRTYVLPEGTVIEATAAPVISFRATGPVTLSPDRPVVTVTVQAASRGPGATCPPDSNCGSTPVGPRCISTSGRPRSPPPIRRRSAAVSWSRRMPTIGPGCSACPVRSGRRTPCWPRSWTPTASATRRSSIR